MYKQLNGRTRHKQEEKSPNSNTHDYYEPMKTNHEHPGRSTAPEDCLVVLKYAYLHI